MTRQIAILGRLTPALAHRFWGAVCGSLLSMLWASSACPAAMLDVKPEIRVSADSVQVAEPFTVELRVQAPAGTRVVFPDVAATWGEFDVLQHRDRFDIPINGTELRLWSRQLTLETIVTGNLQLPPIPLQLITADGRTACPTARQTVRVISALESQADPTKFREIKDVVDVSVPKSVSYRWLLWTVGGLAGLALAGMGVVTTVRRKSVITPRQWAEQKLRQLGQSQAVVTGDSHACFDQLELTLRKYLEWQFGIPAQQLTGQELVDTLQASKASQFASTQVIQQLQRLLEASDRVRFAGEVTQPQQLASAIEEACSLVQSLEMWQQAVPVGSGPELVEGGKA